MGATVCTIILLPLKDYIVARCPSRKLALAIFFAAAAGACLVMELAMGFMLNQPNAAGEYPLWDNSNLPLNILGQAWLVNDLALGAVATLYTWAVYPATERLLARVPRRAMDVIAAVIVVGFIVLCAVKFS